MWVFNDILNEHCNSCWWLNNKVNKSLLISPKPYEETTPVYTEEVCFVEQAARSFQFAKKNNRNPSVSLILCHYYTVIIILTNHSLTKANLTKPINFPYSLA